jgi:hypothetical protein
MAVQVGDATRSGCRQRVAVLRARPLNRRRYHRPMTGGAVRRAGWLARLAVLVVLVTGCERSAESGAEQPRSVTTAAEAAPAGLRV